MSVVLFVHQSAEMYGSDKVLLYLVQGLQARGDFQPVVVLPEVGPLHAALIEAGIEVHVAEVGKVSRSVVTPAGLFRLVRSVFRGVRDLNRIAGNRTIALVHSNTLAVISGAVWAMLLRKPHLWHVHEIILSPKLASRAFPWLVRLLSDRVMSNSTLTERWLLSEQPALASRSVVVFNGLPMVARPAEAAILAFRASVGASGGDVIVTLAGRLNHWKGQGLLIEAAAELLRRGHADALRFVIVGGPAPGLEDLPAQLKAQVSSCGLDEYFTFLHFIDDIWPVWFGTDIAVVPSTEPEPFGMVAIEAMAASVPVVAAGHGGLLDIVVHEETGLIFSPSSVIALADALEQLASDSALRRAFGAAGAKRQREHFSVESQVNRTADVYRDMLK